eukprot:3529843-Amphidinium_carterae.1
MPNMSSEVSTREGGVHWPLCVSLDDMMCDWSLPSSSEYMRLAQVRAREEYPTALRCQFGHCPDLPWVVNRAHPTEMGYIGNIRCLGLTTQGSE